MTEPVSLAAVTRRYRRVTALEGIDLVVRADEVLAEVAERAGRTFWINPEPRLYWNYGDSVMASYEPFCDGVFECWTTKQLEAFVNAIAELRAVA